MKDTKLAIEHIRAYLLIEMMTYNSLSEEQMREIGQIIGLMRQQNEEKDKKYSKK
jgi:hypothetical protein